MKVIGKPREEKQEQSLLLNFATGTIWENEQIMKAKIQAKKNRNLHK